MKHSIEDIGTLVEMGINKQQALATLALFPDLDDAMLVINAYRHQPEGFKRYVGDYSNYLATLRDASRGVTGDRTAHDQEVAERTAMVPEEVLTRSAYRKDKPSSSSHYWEHETTRQLDLGS